jgi:hypothetical protein
MEEDEPRRLMSVECDGLVLSFTRNGFADARVFLNRSLISKVILEVCVDWFTQLTDGCSVGGRPVSICITNLIHIG